MCELDAGSGEIETCAEYVVLLQLVKRHAHERYVGQSTADLLKEFRDALDVEIQRVVAVEEKENGRTQGSVVQFP